MELDITQAQFERYVPAFRSPTDEVFRKLTGFIGAQIDRWGELVKADADEDFNGWTVLVRAVCLRAAYEAVPHLDLVLTPTGFGIVSNQNTAPASRDRVQALRESLRRDANRWEDNVLTALAAKRLLAYPQLTVRSLLWNATLMRHLGIRTEQGAEVYEEEREALQPDLFMAEQEVKAVISPELYDALVQEQWQTDGRTPFRGQLADRVREVLAVLIRRDKQAAAVRAGMMRALLDTIQTHASELPEYAGSRTAEAQNFQRYENEQDDACFFFG